MEQSTIKKDEKKGKHTTIVVNGRQEEAEGKEIGFEEVVKLAYDPVPSGENVAIVVTFSGAKGPRHEGILGPGETVEIKNGTSFSVKVNNKS